jgi:pyruvate kinase
MSLSVWETLPAPPSSDNPAELLAALLALRQVVREEGQRLYERWRPAIQRRAFRPGAQNLAHYLVLRQHDIRPLQAALRPWGLSSLGRSESRVLPNLDAVAATLGMLSGAEPAWLPDRPPQRAFFRGERLLRRATDEVLGPEPANRGVRIMVTFPTEAAGDYALVRALMERGMDCARINCAHDTPDAWRAMVAHVRRAERETGRRCRVLMDLGGPKVRTGPVTAPKGTRLVRGDTMLLTRNEADPISDAPVRAVCQAPEVLDQVAVGAPVWLDDGKLGAVVEARQPAGLVLRVTRAPAKGYKLRPEKGVNFPDTDLSVTPLTDKDRADLAVVVAEADMVGYSFVQTADDIALLREELARHLAPGRPPLAIIAKIETRRAVANLPELIVQAAARQPFGVMIARGDLAVEIGFERLAEIQEEVLWLCEAAHVPVIWATQVMEDFVKDGTPSRGEVTDAAMSARAECVMLNKGPYIVEAVSVVNDVLVRMQGHLHKKTPQLRALHVWSRHLA